MALLKRELYRQVKGPEVTSADCCSLVLLRHKAYGGARLSTSVVQQGHRLSLLMRARLNRRRMVAIEFGMWRSVLKGRISGSVIFGKRRFFERPGGTRS